ncbi:MAG: DNA-deoxyinosine glycosylase [Oscillospiraceae bacterium]|nr:DNA-deoxyinosine glycosylase [Oscillospiraceae bacterium]
MEELVLHTFPPVWDSRSRLLILGTMPSPRSRENGFYYTHPQNRFWPVLAEVFQEPLPRSNEERRALALRHGIALWDVLHACAIRGADDSSISHPQPNDIAALLAKSGIRQVFTTGQKAYTLYNKYCFSSTGVTACPLPSTSPANCRWYPRERLVQEYRVLLQAASPKGK